MSRSEAGTAVARARSRWPELALERFSGELPAGPCGDDVLLARACLAGDRAALAVLEREALLPAGQHLLVRGHAETVASEALQLTRGKLLMAGPAGAAAALSDYAGEGSLASFVRVVAVHCAASLCRRSPSEGDAQLVDELAGGLDAERALLRAELGSVLREALVQALARLTPRERALLRFHFLDGVSVDGLSRVYGVHRATCARWLATARQTVAAHVRDHLRQSLEHSGLDVTFSQIELGLSGLLRGA